MRKSSQIRILITLSAAVALLATACSSSKDNNSSVPATSASGGGTASAAEVVIGAVGSYTGPYAPFFGGSPKIDQAWVTITNNNGGINGHKIRLITKDIGAATGAGLTAVKDLIENEHVVAIVDDSDAADVTWASYVRSKNVPVIGGASQVTFLTNPNFFSVGPSIISADAAAVNVAKGLGGKWGLFWPDTPGADQYLAYFRAVAKALDLPISVFAKVPSTTTDFTALCQQIISGGLTSFTAVLNSNLIQRMTEACSAQGVKATQILFNGTVDPSWKTNKVFFGAITAPGVAPYFLDNTPAHKAYRDAVAKYAPSAVGTTQDNPFLLNSWASMTMFGVGLKNVTGEVTSASLTQGLNQIKNETLGGLVPTATYLPGQANPSKCYFTFKITDGSFTGDDTQTCIPDDIFATMLAAIGTK